MKKALLFIFVAGLIFSLNTHAQEKEPGFGIKFSGFVKNDFFWDSRQIACAREGHFLLWPSSELLDANGVDINAKSSYNFLAVQSRLTGKITGPDAFGAKTSGLIEGDFFAQANDNINLFRLRHALIKFNWTNTEILTGQYWNPLFVTGCFPGTVSFNTGTPLQSFSRNPQIRITHNMGGFSVILAALSQRDYASRGPDPADNSITIASSQFLRNSSVPDMHMQLHYSTSKESGMSMLMGTGVAYKTLVPRLSSTVGANTYVVDEEVGGLSAIVFSKIVTKSLTFKIQGRYGENNADVLSISGYAVKEVVDAATGLSTYTPLRNATAWGEIHTNGKKLQLGIFGGYMQNLGTKETMSNTNNSVYGLSCSIASLYRISPRIILISKKTKIACELEYTSASFGSNYDLDYIPANTSTVANTRLLLSAIYSF